VPPVPILPGPTASGPAERADAGNIVSLMDCGARHQIVVDYVIDLIAGLAGDGIAGGQK
jgi:hypothetical protein